MTGDDDGAPAARILSWAWLLALIFLSSIARAFYSSQAAEPSARFEVLCYVGRLTLLWYLVKIEGRTAGTTFPMDTGFFLGLFSFLAVPFLLWRRQRWRSVGKMALLVAAWLAGYELSVALHHAIVWLQ